MPRRLAAVAVGLLGASLVAPPVFARRPPPPSPGIVKPPPPPPKPTTPISRPIAGQNSGNFSALRPVPTPLVKPAPAPAKTTVKTTAPAPVVKAPPAPVVRTSSTKAVATTSALTATRSVAGAPLVSVPILRPPAKPTTQSWALIKRPSP